MNLLSSFDGLFWLMTALALLVILQRSLHLQIQAIFLILTRRPGLTEILFALIFLPGVFLHELSHFLTAKILGVRTGRFSLIPQSQPNGKLRLGYVETESGGFVRDALIGAAPLVLGSLFVAFTAIDRFHLLPLWNLLLLADWGGFWNGLLAVPSAADFWLWFYLTFTVSSTMMPSASDRHAWLPFGLVMATLVGIAILAGAGPWMLQHLADPFNPFLRALALIFGISGVIHILLILPLLLIHIVLSKITHLVVA